MAHVGAAREGTVLLDGRYRVRAPVADGVLLRELAAFDEHAGRDVSVWLPCRGISPAAEDIEAEIGNELAGCRRVFDRGQSSAYIVGASADHVGPRPRRTPHARAVIAGWFRAVAGIIDRNHRVGRWHGVLTCDDVAILGGKLVVAGFGFWVRADPESIASAIAPARDATGAMALRDLVAPEVLQCAIGPAADLWALGNCTLLLASSSQGPRDLDALAERHPALADALGALLDPEPDRRTIELRDLADRVTAALETPFFDEEDGSPRVYTAKLRPLRPPPSSGSGGSRDEVRTESLSVDDLVPVNDFADAGTVAEPPSRRGAVRPPPPPQDLTTVDDLEPASAHPTFEPATGIWTGTAITAIEDGPGVVVPTPWSPASRPPIQVISMKEEAREGRPARAARVAPLVPRIRAVELSAAARPSPAALGRIAPPRAHTQPAAEPRRWPMTLLVIAVAIAALLFAAALLWT